MYAFIIICRSCFSAVPRLNNSVFTGGIRQVKVEVEPYNHTGRTFWTRSYDAYGLYVCNTMYAWIISCRRYLKCIFLLCHGFLRIRVYGWYSSTESWSWTYQPYWKDLPDQGFRFIWFIYNLYGCTCVLLVLFNSKMKDHNVFLRKWNFWLFAFDSHFISTHRRKVLIGALHSCDHMRTLYEPFNGVCV